MFVFAIPTGPLVALVVVLSANLIVEVKKLSAIRDIRDAVRATK